MNVTVLQGLNHINPVTTVIAEMEAVKPDLLDFFKQLHPVFMVDYTIRDGKVLEVETHIPYLWKNDRFLTAIEAFSTGRRELSAARTDMLDVVKLLINSMSTIPILSAAHKLGYETYPFYSSGEKLLEKNSLNRYYSIGIGKETTVTVSASSVGDSTLAFKTQRDKWFTNQFVEAMGLPIAPWEHVNVKEDLPKIAERMGFPLVIKPVGLTGGHAVFVGITSVEELEEAYDKIKAAVAEKPSLSAWQGEIIVQKKVEGDDFRVLVINGKVEIATHRIPASVTGDGMHTIRELIEIENKNPARDTTLPTHTLKPIVIDEDLELVVQKNGHTLNDVLQDGEQVFVRRVASMSQGGITKDVTDEIHPQTKLICETIGASIFANVLGVDVLCKDISKPLTPDNGSILEMNTMPETYLNSFPVIGTQRPEIGEKIVQALIRDDVHTHTVVVIGTVTPETISEQIVHAFGQQAHTGIFHGGDIVIDGYMINTGLSTPSGLTSVKKNKKLSTIAFHVDTAKDIFRYGLGFNTIDLLIRGGHDDTPEEKELDELIERYRSSGHIHNVVSL